MCKNSALLRNVFVKSGPNNRKLFSLEDTSKDGWVPWPTHHSHVAQGPSGQMSPDSILHSLIRSVIHSVIQHMCELMASSEWQ